MDVDAGPADEFAVGERKIIQSGNLFICVYNLGGELLAIEDRCSHDDGPLCEGEHDAAAGTVTCPRHGSMFDIRSGRALNLPAYLPVDTYPLRVEDGRVIVEVPS